MNALNLIHRRRLLLRAAAGCAAAAGLPARTLAHGPADPAKAPAPMSTTRHAWGRQGDPRQVSRDIDIRMSDRMRYTPDHLLLTEGDTVRLRLRNGGKLLHELVIGTRADLEQHAELMRKHPGMEHDEPYMAHVAAGARGEIVWTFDQPGEFLFGCLLPGHWQAGMQGRITVRPRRP